MPRKSLITAVAGTLGLAVLLSGCGRTGQSLFSLEPVARAGRSFQNPLDAVPGKPGTIYFTADGPSGPGVFAASSADQAPAAVAVGRPFQRPVGIALSSDLATVFVADAQADAVFTVPVAGGTPVALPGSAGLRPRGVEVKGDQLYLTGVDPQSGKPAVLSLPAAGGQAKVLATGLVLPDGVAVGDDGTVFVTDRFGGTVLRVAGGTATPLPGVSDILLGQPAGVAVGPDGSSLLVSSLDPKDSTAQVLIVNIASGATSVFDDVIGDNHGAGGIHRAPDGSAYAWADASANSQGSVYHVQPRAR
jgi:sugar lactone lactonase YvrE